MKEIDHSNNIRSSIEEKEVRQRLRTLLKLALDIGRRKGLIGTGMTVEQVQEILRRESLETNSQADQTSNVPDKVEDVRMITSPVVKEIRIRLPQDQWERIRQEARKLYISPAELSRRWIFEALSKRNSDLMM